MRDHNENFQEPDHREHPNLPQWGGDYLEENEDRPCDRGIDGWTLACGSPIDAP
jgi:hypothetical protein